ncbi:MAG: D-alanine--D-alanine ligase [Gammaproteobacteria bacterium]
MKISSVVVLYGGTSSEREISLQSGQNIYEALQSLGYKAELLDFKDLEYIDKLRDYDFVFIALHGHEGESGLLQENLDRFGIKYSGSDSIGCKNTWNKRRFKDLLMRADISTPKYKGYESLNGLTIEDYKSLSFLNTDNSIFLKPAADGSSVDTFEIKNENEFIEAIKSVHDKDREFIFEQGIKFKEFTVTIIDKDIYPPIEILADGDFYNYEAKYISEDTQLIKAELSDEEQLKIQEIAIQAFNISGASGWGRVDLVQDTFKNFYILEINTVPGMTSHSCVPRSGSLSGLTYNDVVKNIINASL